MSVQRTRPAQGDIGSATLVAPAMIGLLRRATVVVLCSRSMKRFLLGVLLFGGAARGVSDDQPIRMVCSLAFGNEGRVEIRVENPTPMDLSATLLAELVLDPEPGPVVWDPLLPDRSYRSPLDLSTSPARPTSGSTALAIRARDTRVWAAQPSGLLWYEKVSATRSGERCLRAVVPPGRYVLVLEVRAPDKAWWRSNQIHVDVGGDGGLSARQDVEP